MCPQVRVVSSTPVRPNLNKYSHYSKDPQIRQREQAREKAHEYAKQFSQEHGGKDPLAMLFENPKFKIKIVNGTKLRQKGVDFVFGGHHYVYKFIPKWEIWIEKAVPVTERKAIIVHEIEEYHKMEKGMSYPKAHAIANKKERKFRVVNTTKIRTNPSDPQSDAKSISFKEFSKKYIVLFHGGPENISEGKLKRHARKGYDQGGIFFTPEIELAKQYASTPWEGGKGKVHTVLVKQDKIFDPRKPSDVSKLKKKIGKTYVVDDDEAEFTQQEFDHLFTSPGNIDWNTFDEDVFKSFGYDGVIVTERSSHYGEGKHLYTYVLFEGGKESPHWFVPSGTTLESFFNEK